MRIGEVEHLTWEDLDYDNGVIHVRARPGWRVKTGDVRSVPMSGEIRALLLRQPRITEWVFAFPEDRYGPARQIRQRRLLDYLKRRLEKLGLKGHLHTFRHSFISSSLTNGTPEAMVRAWVGHVDAETMRHYTHIASCQSREAMERREIAVAAKRSSAAKTPSVASTAGA